MWNINADINKKVEEWVFVWTKWKRSKTHTNYIYIKIKEAWSTNGSRGKLTQGWKLSGGICKV